MRIFASKAFIFKNYILGLMLYVGLSGCHFSSFGYGTWRKKTSGNKISIVFRIYDRNNVDTFRNSTISHFWISKLRKTLHFWFFISVLIDVGLKSISFKNRRDLLINLATRELKFAACQSLIIILCLSHSTSSNLGILLNWAATFHEFSMLLWMVHSFLVPIILH